MFFIGGDSLGIGSIDILARPTCVLFNMVVKGKH